MKILAALFRLADIAIFPFVRQFAGVDPSWFAAQAPQRVVEWLVTLAASALFERAMIKAKPWAEQRR